MNLSMMKKNIYLLFLLCLSGVCVCANDSDSPLDRKGPLSLADPFIMLHNDTYYAYGTNAEDGIEVYTSENLKEWRKEQNLALHKNDSFGDKWFWAPEESFL